MSKIAGTYNIMRLCQSVFPSGCTTLHSHNHERVSALAVLNCIISFYSIHLNEAVVLSNCSFLLDFPNNHWNHSIFYVHLSLIQLFTWNVHLDLYQLDCILLKLYSRKHLFIFINKYWFCIFLGSTVLFPHVYITKTLRVIKV